MHFLATKLALNELNKCKITETDVMLDRAIFQKELNSLHSMFNVVVIPDGNELVTITHPTEDVEQDKWYEIEYKNGEWKIK